MILDQSIFGPVEIVALLIKMLETLFTLRSVYKTVSNSSYKSVTSPPSGLIEASP